LADLQCNYGHLTESASLIHLPEEIAMRFVPDSADLDCESLLVNPEGVVDDLVRRAVERLHDGGVTVFRIGRLRLGQEESRDLAQLVSSRLRDMMVALGAPPALRLEIDRPQTTDMPPGAQIRTRLPHFDGQHCSYLTPSGEDVPGWDPSQRAFSSSGYTTTAAHKLYQGIFIADPGYGLSVTTYYDWLSIIDDVLSRRRINRDGDRDVKAAERWLGENISRMFAMQADHGCSYPSLGGMLGLTEEAFHGMSFANAEDPLNPEVGDRYPVLWPMTQECPCGTCIGDTGRVFCHLLVQSIGTTWPAFRQRYEILVPTERYDLVIGHNLTMLHGGWAGAPDRLLEPLCLVVDEPAGAGYEQWLAASWRRTMPVQLAVAAGS
jgi:hypothetical protein